ncbi:MAG: septum formation initiator family protein [Clostridia bacterium]|nr:septum formation initiator family protein [Clostridia bacterium]
MLVSVTIAVLNLMRLNQIQNEAIRLALEKEELQYRVDELKYRLNSPIDDAYIERVAREKLGLYFPDEIVYFNGMK